MGPAQPCGSIPVFQGTGLGSDSLPLSHALTPPSDVWRLLLYPESDSNRSPSLPCFEHLFPSHSVIHHFPSCLLRFLSVFLIHTNTHSNMTSTPSSFPLPEIFSSVYSPKLYLPNTVKLELQRLCSALSHPIWKSCFFPCGPGILFTGDSRAGNGAHNVLKMMHMLCI